MPSHYETYRTYQLPERVDRPSPADIARAAHNERMQGYDYLESAEGQRGRIEDALMRDKLSVMDRWSMMREIDVVIASIHHEREKLAKVPRVILENVDALMSDENPALRAYALEHYVPLVEQHGPSANLVELHDAKMTSIAKDVERLKRKP